MFINVEILRHSPTSSSCRFCISLIFPSATATIPLPVDRSGSRKNTMSKQEITKKNKAMRKRKIAWKTLVKNERPNNKKVTAKDVNTQDRPPSAIRIMGSSPSVV
jgi:hypothetical protein